MPGSYANMAKKCVAQMPHPVAAPAAAIQIARKRPMVERARLNNVIAVRLDRKQTSPATTTSRQSCCVVKQDKMRNMTFLHQTSAQGSLGSGHRFMRR